MYKVENSRCRFCKEVESVCECDYDEIQRSSERFECGVMGFIKVVIFIIAMAVTYLIWASVIVDFTK